MPKRQRIEDPFWSEYIRLVREVVVPYQWDALNDRVPEAEPSYAIRNFKIAAGEERGRFRGMVFQDSDVAKWLEAAAYLLETEPDPALEAAADEVIGLIGRAQGDDGYVNTYFTLEEPEGRWTNLAECHELYVAGHLIEAGVAYWRATGKTSLLRIASRLADYIDTVFGPEPGKLHGYDGHPEIELALMKLYEASGNEAYMRLSQYFLNQRGAKPDFYSDQWEKRGGAVHFHELDMNRDLAYSQAHLPVREQRSAEGHAVRLVYMCAGMADVAAETGDEEMMEACRRLWRSIVSRRMYITGGIGSQRHGESFTLDYDLPGDTAYAETCASIGLVFFARRMLEHDPHAEYADVMERALYNTVVGGMSRDGRRFFYVNPLEVFPALIGRNRNYDHVKPVRQGWFGCACCPPNIARLLASLGQYIYVGKGRTIYANLYIGGESRWEIDGAEVMLEQQSDYAWNGKSRLTIRTGRPVELTLALRIPDWTDASGVELLVNGALHPIEGAIADGYARLTRAWESGDQVDIRFPLEIRRMKGHPSVRHTVGKVALQRGPFVYCLEEADNGPELHRLRLPGDGELLARRDGSLLGGLTVIEGTGERISDPPDEDKLYAADVDWGTEPAALRWIPYYAWANRGEGEMAVWIGESGEEG